MLKKKVLTELNKQINAELYSAYLYLSMSAWFQTQNLGGFAHWMQLQAQEEAMHAMKIFTYINDNGSAVELKGIKDPQKTWASPAAAMQDAYNHECKVSKSINDIVSLTIQEEDHATNVFLQWFVTEQVEEEAAADAVVQKLKMVENFAGGLFIIDGELGQRAPGA
jgi:ferritin